MEKASFRFLTIRAEAVGLPAIKIMASVCIGGMATMIALAAIYAFAH